MRNSGSPGLFWVRTDLFRLWVTIPPPVLLMSWKGQVKFLRQLPQTQY